MVWNGCVCVRETDLLQHFDEILHDIAPPFVDNDSSRKVSQQVLGSCLHGVEIPVPPDTSPHCHLRTRGEDAISFTVNIPWPNWCHLATASAVWHNLKNCEQLQPFAAASSIIMGDNGAI